MWRLAVTGPIGVGKDTVCRSACAVLDPEARPERRAFGELVVADLEHALSLVEVADVRTSPAGRTDEDRRRLAELCRAARTASVPGHHDGGLMVDRLDLDVRRSALQWWGAVRRRVNPAYWLDAMDAALDSTVGPFVYVPDVRTAAEAVWLRARCFVVAEIWAPEGMCAARQAHRDGRVLRADLRRTDEWATERVRTPGGIAGIDLLVDNSGSVQSAVAALVEALRARWVTTVDDFGEEPR